MKTPISRPLTRDEITAMVGPVDDAVVTAILGLEPTRRELDEAITWATGADDVMGEMERPQEAKVARIIEILTLEEGYGEER